MVEVGDRAPDFTAPVVADEVSTFTLSAELRHGPVVLVFFPAAFTGTCQTELQTFHERLGRFREMGAQVFGLSVDSPLVLSEFRDRQKLDLPLISDIDREIIEAYDVTEDFPDYHVTDIAARAVLVVDREQMVAWRWRGEPGDEPDYEAVEDAIVSLSETEGISPSTREPDL